MKNSALKKFAAESRRMLIAGVRGRLNAMGFNADGSLRFRPKAIDGGATMGDGASAGAHAFNFPDFTHLWEALHTRIQVHGAEFVVEEAAYTWFNRLMALRILARNGLAPAALDYVDPAVRLPRVVTDARAGHTPPLSEAETNALGRIIRDSSRTYDQFALLIRAVCADNGIIRGCFGGITDYSFLLLPQEILVPGAFIDKLNEADEFISADDWRTPELIGWLYQFYISEKKDEVFAKKGGYTSDDIPAATQIFTPNWIVKYMVQNTLGRIYLDNNPSSPLAASWQYLVPEPSAQEESTASPLPVTSLESLTCADLSCGSGHILNEMFDLLLQLYADDFYSPREAIEAIFRKNMVGVDIDIRARQLAQFALRLKASQVDSAFADGHCMPRIYAFPDVHEDYFRDTWGHFMHAYQLVNEGAYNVELREAFRLMGDASALGSIMKFDLSETTRQFLTDAVARFESNPQHIDAFTPLIEAFRIMLALTDKYAAICMNPPYMPTNKEPRLKAYATANYPDSKADLFAVFMDVAMARLQEHGKYGMINMQSWMFLSSFEALRKNIIDNQQIDSLLHLGPRTFDELSGEVVQNAAFVITNAAPSYPGVYYRLTDGKSCDEKRQMYLDGLNRYVVDQKQFEQIPGAPIAYWVSDKIRETFTNNLPLSAVCKPTQGLATADNGRFVRSWFEVAVTKIGFGCESTAASVASGRKFFPFNKGGSQRKWYGDQGLVVNWENDGEEIKAFKGAVIRNPDYYFRECIGWSDINSGKNTGFKCFPKGFIFEVCGRCCFDMPNLLNLLGTLNTPLYPPLVKILNPTIHFQVGDFKKLPYMPVEDSSFDTIVEECIALSKQDWDAHETSWDFQRNELIKLAADPPHRDNAMTRLRELFIKYSNKWRELLLRLHANEEELNRRFIALYGLEDELSPEVPLEEVTILQQGETTISGDPDSSAEASVSFNKDVVVKQLISYAVGCMMGRYRLDRPGLAIAHPRPSAAELAHYVVVDPTGGMDTWWIDDDGIVPMMAADAPFIDNAPLRIREFLLAALGQAALTDNMNFLREALGKDVDEYLRTDFYADHKRMYQNRPIYWMFSSNQKGKRAAFQCLVYMHRMTRFTPEHIRTNYLLPYIDHLAAREAALTAKPSLSTAESKELKQLKADLAECRDYQLRLHDFADLQIEIDLDDGVAHNYALFAPVLAKLK